MLENSKVKSESLIAEELINKINNGQSTLLAGKSFNLLAEALDDIPADSKENKKIKKNVINSLKDQISENKVFGNSFINDTIYSRLINFEKGDRLHEDFDHIHRILGVQNENKNESTVKLEDRPKLLMDFITAKSDPKNYYEEVMHILQTSKADKNELHFMTNELNKGKNVGFDSYKKNIFGAMIISNSLDQSVSHIINKILRSDHNSPYTLIKGMHDDLKEIATYRPEILEKFKKELKERLLENKDSMRNKLTLKLVEYSIEDFERSENKTNKNLVKRLLNDKSLTTGEKVDLLIDMSKSAIMSNNELYIALDDHPDSKLSKLMKLELGRFIQDGNKFKKDLSAIFNYDKDPKKTSQYIVEKGMSHENEGEGKVLSVMSSIIAGLEGEEFINQTIAEVKEKLGVSYKGLAEKVGTSFEYTDFFEKNINQVLTPNLIPKFKTNKIPSSQDDLVEELKNIDPKAKDVFRPKMK